MFVLAAPNLKRELKQSWKEEVYIENIRFSKLLSEFHSVMLMHLCHSALEHSALTTVQATIPKSYASRGDLNREPS